MLRLKILLLLMVAIPALSVGQSRYYLRADSVYVEKGGGNGELIIRNATRDSTGGLLVNIGGGRTAFIKARQISDSSFAIGQDTIVIRGAGGVDTIHSAGDGYPLIIGNDTLRSLKFAGNWGFLDTVGTPGIIRIGITPQVGFGLNVDGFTDEIYVDSTRSTGIPTYYYVDSVAEASTGSINDSIADLNATWSSQYIVDNSRLFINPYSKEAVAFGDSYTDPNVEVSTSDKMWINLFSQGAGIPINNQAASGGGVVEMFKRAINVLPKTNNAYSAVTLTGFNDNIRGGMNQKELDKIYSGYMAFFANFYLSTAVPVSASAVTKYGTWSTLNGSTNFPLKAATLSSGSGRSNTNTNDSLVWTFTGPTCVVGFINSDDTAVGFTMGDFEVFIDNVSHGTYTGNNKALHVQDSWWSNKYSNNAVVLFNLGTGTHKLKIVHKDDNPLYIDYFGTLVSAKEGMNILVGTIPKIGPDGYALRNVASVVTTDTANAYILRAVRTFTDMGYPICITDVNRYYTLDGVSSDDIHPNDLGNRQLANAFLSKTANIPPMGISYNSVGTDGEIYTFGENAYYNTVQGLSKIDTALGAQVMFFDNRTSTTLSTGLFNMQPGNSGATSYIFRALKDGNFGIGTSSSNDATRKLDVNGDARIRSTLHVGNATEPSFTPVGSITSFGDNNRNGYTSYVYSGSTNRGTSINSFFARGTMASPAATQAGDRMMGVGAIGYTGSSYPDSSNSVIMFVASENYGPANQGGHITFITTPTGSAVTSRAERMRLTGSGGLFINATTGANIDPRRLYVNGSVGMNKDSMPMVTEITSEDITLIDTSTGQSKRIKVSDLSVGGGGVINLGYTASPTGGQVTNSTGGTAASIPLATTTNAGLQSPEDKEKLQQNTYFFNAQSGISMDSTLYTPNDSAFAARQHHVVAGSNKISVDSSEDTESFTDIIDINEENLDLANIGGSLPANKLTAPGSSTQLIFNNSGALGTDADLTYNASTNVLSVPKIMASGSDMSIFAPSGQKISFGVNTTEYLSIGTTGAIVFGTGSDTYNFPFWRPSAGQVLNGGNGSGSLSWNYLHKLVAAGTTTSGSTITPDADANGFYTITALATNPTIAAPSGSPVDGQSLLIRIKDNGSSRTITWNEIYRAGTDFALPTATVAGETLYIQFIYNDDDDTWDAVGLTQGF